MHFGLEGTKATGLIVLSVAVAAYEVAQEGVSGLATDVGAGTVVVIAAFGTLGGIYAFWKFVVREMREIQHDLKEQIGDEEDQTEHWKTRALKAEAELEARDMGQHPPL